MIEKNIMKLMDEISYGVPDKNNKNLLEIYDEDEVFSKYYYLQTPEELKKSKLGTCWDQVELERKYFEDKKINVKTYFICTYDEENLPSHTFLTYEKNNKFYWFEHSWNQFKGIHEYQTEKSLLLDVKYKFLNSHITNENAFTFIYEYKMPKPHITCNKFYSIMEKEKIVKLNDPLYFYHLVPKNADLSKGLLSPKYMYQNKLHKLFDESIEKYRSRIVDSWNIAKYKNRDEKTLTREEIIDALNIFRGKEGSNYIYFFKFPPVNIGKNMDKLLKTKEIYKININDEEIQKNILDIYWGNEQNEKNNKKLNKIYYQNINEKEYFKNYDDNSKILFKNINHISIAFKNNYCKKEYLEKID
jgi:hypothetical protein